MAARLPRTVKIGPHTYRVKIDGAAVDRLAKEHGRPLDAYTDFQDHTIVMQRKQSDRRRTLLHETLHALLDLSGIDLRLGSKKPPDDEEIIQSLDGMLLAVLRDNPTLLAFLTEP